MGSTVSNLIFVLSCCRTHRRFSIKPSVETNRSSAWDRRQKQFQQLLCIKLAQVSMKAEGTFKCDHSLKSLTGHAVTTASRCQPNETSHPSTTMSSLASAEPESADTIHIERGTEGQRMLVSRQNTCSLLSCPSFSRILGQPAETPRDSFPCKLVSTAQ